MIERDIYIYKEREYCNWSLFLFQLVYVYRRIDINRVHTMFISFALIFPLQFPQPHANSSFFLFFCLFALSLFWVLFRFVGVDTSFTHFTHTHTHKYTHTQHTRTHCQMHAIFHYKIGRKCNFIFIPGKDLFLFLSPFFSVLIIWLFYSFCFAFIIVQYE